MAALALWCVLRVVRWCACKAIDAYIVRSLSCDDSSPLLTERVIGASSVAGASWAPIHKEARMRLRKRSRWVCCLQRALHGERGAVGALFRGRWVPDLPSVEGSRLSNFLAALTSDGVRFRGGGICHGKQSGDEPSTVCYLFCELSDGSVKTIFPDLVAKLTNHAVFRTRNAALLALLRLRALEWRRDVGLDHCDLAWGLADSVSLASAVTSWEASATQWLAERGMSTKVDA